MCGALARFYTYLLFQIASAKLDIHYAFFLRN